MLIIFVHKNLFWQDEKPSFGSSGPGKVSDFKAKFEKFGPSAKRPSLSKYSVEIFLCQLCCFVTSLSPILARTPSIPDEEKSTGDEAQKVIKDLQAQIKGLHEDASAKKKLIATKHS